MHQILQKPNLFLIGAMKSGTTYLNSLLGAHPSIFMCYPEEPSYFVTASALKVIWPYMWEKGYWRSEENYLDLFKSATNCTILGEASTNYTKLPLIKDVPEKIFKFNPHARFIYIMRDPIERTISHYWHMVRYHSEYRKILKALTTDKHYLDVSYYAMQLKPYIDIFGEKNITTLTYEELINNPKSTLNNLYNWLGVDPNFIPKETGIPVNVTPPIIEKASGLGLLHKFRHSMIWSSIRPYMPKTLTKFGSKLSIISVDKNAISTIEVENYLRPIQIKQTEELSNLLGREFTEWKTLYRYKTE